MRDEDKTKGRLIEELRDLRCQIAAFERVSAATEPIASDETQNADRFRSLYEEAPLPYQSLDENGNFIDVNNAWLDTLGYKKEEVIGKSFGDFLHPEAVEHFKKNFPRFKAVGGVSGVEFQMLKKNGTPILASFHGKIGVDRHGNFRQTHCIFQDITQQRAAVQQVEAAYSRHRSILQTAMDGFWLTDLRGNLIEVNDAYCRMSGYSEQELLTRKIDDMEAMLTPADTSARIREIIAAGEGRFQSRHKRKDGNVFDVEVSVKYRSEEGGRLVSFLRDITDRKLAESAVGHTKAMLERTESLAHIGSWEWDVENDTVTWSEELYRIFGLDLDQRAPAWAEHPKLYHPEDMVRLRSAVEKAVATGAPYELELRGVRKDGRTVYCRAMGTAEMGPNGSAARLSGFLEDITERKLLEDAQSFLLQCGLPSTGEDFFASLARYLAEKLAMEYVCIDRLLGDCLSAQTTAVYYDGHFEDNISYTLKDTPCAEVVEKTLCCHLDNVRHRFPKDAALQDLMAESYVGTLLFDSKGAPIGLIALIGRRPLKDSRQAELLLRLAAPRAAAELERRRSEDALRMSEERYRNISSSISAFVFSCIKPAGGAYEIDWLAGSVERITGYSVEEVLDRRCLKFLIHPDDIPTFEKSVIGLEAGSLGQCELRIMHKDGSIRWIRTVSRAAQCQGLMEPCRLFGSCEDIADRKQAEEALQESERRYRIVADHTYDWEYWVRPDGTLAYVSPSCKRITGYGAEEFIQNPSLLVSITHPEDREWFVAHMREPFNSGSALCAKDFRILTRDGEERWINHYCTQIISENGSYLGRRASNRDITDRKQAEQALRESEERYRQLFDNIKDAIFLHLQTADGMPGRIVETNEAACKRLGYTRDELLQMSPLDIDAPDTLDGVSRVMEELCQKGHATWEGAHITRDGLRIPVEINNLLFEFRSMPMILATARDITERKKAEKEKEMLNEQLNRAQKLESVGRLAGGVAHDFNNMLSVILGHAEMAIEQIDQENALFADLTEIRKAAERSADLTRQLLAFARRQVISPKVLDLTETVEGTLKMLRRLIGEDIDLAWLPGKNLWPVKLDPGQVDQVLANLCVNARDAISGVGKVTIETGTALFDTDYCNRHSGFVPGEFVMLAVSDNGCGMDKETLGKIFEPFYTTKDMGKGTGLGLATVYGIVKQNHGFINVYSEPGQGTTFKIYLPRAEEQTKEKPHLHLKKHQRGEETVLLVEDEGSILALGKTILQRYGYTVLATKNPTEALRMVQSYPDPIHLLITDVVMPEMNGKELKDKLVELRPDLKGIFMSGYTANVIAHHGVLDENIDFLQKPFSVQTLLDKIRDVLDR